MSELDAFLAPRSIAIVGASSNPAKIGAAPLRYLMDLGYEGALYPVNPGAEEVAGLRAYPSLRAIEAPVDLAIFAIPAALVDATLEDAIAAGVRNIVMFSAGFAELGETGEAAQNALLRKARAAGVRILGPNCLGFMNLAQNVYATFSPVLKDGVVESGHIGMVCQSGAFGAYAFAMARERGVGLSCWITTGNESDISVADAIAWMADDTATRVIMVYMEGCSNGAALRRALAKAHRAGKPVVAVKVGRTGLGARTAATHTAALAGEDAVYDALFRQYGVWRVYSIEQFFDVAYCLAVAGIPVNGKVGLLTVSGGVGVMMADDAADAGLDVTPMPPQAQQLIREHVPFAATHNPVDLTGQVTADPSLLESAARIMFDSGDYGSLLIFLSAYGMNPEVRQRLRTLCAQLRKDYPDRLVILSTLSDPEQRRALACSGTPCFSDPARAIQVMAALSFFQRAAALDVPERAGGSEEGADIGARRYDEAEAAEILRGYGLPLPPHRVASNDEEAVTAAEALGYPVVMKILSRQITHKSDVAGVRLGLRNAQQVREAFEGMMRDLATAGLADQVHGVMLAPMCPDGIEMIIGVRRDPQFGMVVVLGMGGIHVEVLEDVSLRLAPVSLDDAHQMIRELRSAALLGAFRGRAPADTDALAQSIVALSNFAITNARHLESVEINPLMVRGQGQGVVALDTVLITREPQADCDTTELRRQVLQTLPLFEMARMRAANTARRHPEAGFAGDTPSSRLRWVNQFTHTRRLRSPQDKEVVTPNNDTLFTNAWLDLSDGPLLINVPDMGQRYWVLGFLDAWTNPWAYAGRRTTGNAAQQLFIHGPDWSGEPPAGAHVIASPSRDVWVIGRILVDPEADDLAAVHALQQEFSIRRPDGSPALARVDTLVTPNAKGTPDAHEYLRVLEIMLERNPPETPLGPWPPCVDALQKVLHETYTELREASVQAELGGGWTTALKVSHHYGTDFLTRARIARNWIGTLGVEEAMYIMAEVDADNLPLDGRQSYVLHFTPESLPKVGSFWSLTLYGRSDCMLVANPIDRHSIGDRTRGLVYEPDGGLRIVLQASDPGVGHNWLPTPENDGFYLVLRLYQPAAEHLEGRFSYPPVRRQPSAMNAAAAAVPLPAP